ncbi:hypothetical protein NW762_010838 [Fusarium torreyae]|uniref:RRM domain-containing protein n=1 Tax=Fusarium torreyae TaxID=1237075 RepID=A0A9W8VA29_9HYPO|nr:hypothetical protein NW762_010838 [Fusarium torreyae]
MDAMDLPPQVLNQLHHVPPDVKKWGQLKLWLQQNNIPQNVRNQLAAIQEKQVQLVLQRRSSMLPQQQPLHVPTKASSYWSVGESNDFPRLLRSFGNDWTAIAAHMSTKTPVMVKNYYVHQKDRDKPEWETIVQEAERKKEKGKSLSGPFLTKPSVEKGSTECFVNYVPDKVQEADLRNALAAFGELSYFHVDRQSKFAMVVYKTPENYQAAAAANPHTVNGETIFVEARCPTTS